MWDRLRSATGGGSGGAGNSVDQYSSRTTAAAAINNNNTTPLGRKDRASTFTHNSSSNSSSGRSTPSWQPRSSVIAAREGQGKQQLLQQRPTKPGPPPPRPPRDFQLQPAPTFHEAPSFHQQQRSQTLPPSTSHRDSIQGRPPSSVYSQPSPLVTDFGPRATGGYRYAMSPEEVSPPSSPEDTRARGPVSNYDISPIDEEDVLPTTRPRPLPEPPTKMSSAAHASLPSQQRRNTDTDATPRAGSGARSNIPMMRRERRAQRDAAAAGGRIIATDKPRGQKDPRWDPMTGEITNSDKGRPSQVKPVEFARGLGISTMSSKSPPGPSSPERERTSSRSGSRAGQRAGGAGGSSSATDPAAMAFGAGSGQQRPEWKGASGRTAIVAPVKDTTEVPPLKIPPRSRRRETSRPTTGDEQTQQQATAPGNVLSGGFGAGVGDNEFNGQVDHDAMSRLSPPISPETGPGNKGVGMGMGVVIGGGGSAGSHATATATTNSNSNNTNLQLKGGVGGGDSTSKSTSISTGRSFANTFRKIIPSSSSSTGRLFSGGGASSRNSPTPTPDGSISPNQPSTSAANTATAEHGYPSPPLSGNALVGSNGGGGSTLPVNAHIDAAPSHASNFGNANHAKTGINHHHHQHTHFDNISEEHTPTSSDFLVQPQQQPQPPSSSSIRRKEVGSSLTPTSPRQHITHESFSSSVYSRPDDDNPQPPIFSNSNRPPPAQSNNTKNLPSLPPQDGTYVQPPSRFSVTTYATSAHTSSPRESFDVAPPLPTPPKDIVLGLNLNQKSSSQQQISPDMAASSVLDRQRPQMRGGNNRWEDPIATNDEAPIKISLSKAWMNKPGANSSGQNQQNSPPRTRQPKGPRELAPNKAPTSDTNKENRGMFGFGFLGGSGDNNGPKSPASDESRPASILSNMDKDLPPAPAAPPLTVSSSTSPSNPANTTADRIAQLNALLQDLANRRLNINRAIKQMTELMPQDNLIMQEAVRRKREDEKRKIEELKRRLDDIGREEHELGMKLHRAYKKLDRSAEYEPTTLWVRRATGS
ncbi:hypothetical protein N0V93_004513 [Gnomoniopsis smithogilvyi]|uniref:Uncharacterized protein n=1 Tax=Gnomoniopsis smithogilvyi TaxID=1191159 RepID=A0A9W8YUY2_9PEZI|nr:hypothetical protein N0V93_004513 [Gnomoniopsis smithogilvyi]